MKMLTVRLKCNYGQWKPGDVVSLPSGIAQSMVDANRAESVVETKVVRATKVRNKSLAGS